MIRDRKRILMEVLCPILLVLIGAIISQVEIDNSTPDFETHDIPSIGLQTIYFVSNKSMY